MTRCRHLAVCVVFGSVLLPFSASAQINTLLAQGEARTQEGARAQQRVDALADQALGLVAQYRQELKVVDGLQVYNSLLQRQIDAQENEKQVLTESMNKVSLIERQIVPLMLSMIESLDEFVELDVPFLLEERRKRVADLRALMERSDVTAAEQFRRVLEAYQIENDYGRTIEAYKGSVDIDGKSREVDFLRFGRLSLVYQTVGGDKTGAFNKETRQFEEIPPATYKAQTAKGLRIAKKQVAPDLVFLPVHAPEEAGQ